MDRRHLLLAGAALLLGDRLQAQAGPNCPVQPGSLKAMRDCYRPVLVFAPSAKDASFAKQQALLEQYADDMMDRNLLYVPVLADSAGFKRPLDAPYVVPARPEINAVRQRFKIGPTEFAVILVGKDGGAKFRAKNPVSVLKLDALVDAMPMGRQEKNARTRNAATH